MVTIVILHWNRYEETVECLASLMTITYDPFNIIVVDNGSTDGSATRLEEEFPTVEFIYNGENYGFAKGNNPGIKAALNYGADYVLVLNNDTIVEPGFLGKLIDVGEYDPTIGALSPTIYGYDEHGKNRIIFYAGGHVSMWKGAMIRYRLNQHDHLKNQRPVEKVGFVSGCATLVKRKALQKIGMYDERFFFGTEDADFSWRLKIHGFKIAYVPNSLIWHKVSKSRSFSDGEIYNTIVSKAILMQKHIPSKIFTLFWSIYFIRTLFVLNVFTTRLISNYDLDIDRTNPLKNAIKKAISRGFSSGVKSGFEI